MITVTEKNFNPEGEQKASTLDLLMFFNPHSPFHVKHIIWWRSARREGFSNFKTSANHDFGPPRIVASGMEKAASCEQRWWKRVEAKCIAPFLGPFTLARQCLPPGPLPFLAHPMTPPHTLGAYGVESPNLHTMIRKVTSLYILLHLFLLSAESKTVNKSCVSS